jgi:hypothetical protein
MDDVIVEEKNDEPYFTNADADPDDLFGLELPLPRNLWGYEHGGEG